MATQALALVLKVEITFHTAHSDPKPLLSIQPVKRGLTEDSTMWPWSEYSVV